VAETGIKAIIFDCFGVITTDSWRAFVDTLPADKVDDARYLNRQRDMGLIDNDTFIKDIKDLTGKTPIDVESQLQHEIVKNDALIDYVAELRKRGFKIGMISNIASNWIRESLLTPAEQELFDEMLFSYEVGLAKPDPRIYILACERLRVSTHEAVMIDDVGAYCDAAKGEGLSAIVFTDLQALKSELEAILSSQ
jgi:epoxide hydrolase-like predicted phosphatase